MKSYFLCFEYSGPGYSKYVSGTFQLSFRDRNLIDHCRDLVRKYADDNPIIDADTAQIKVIAFNNIAF